MSQNPTPNVTPNQSQCYAVVDLGSNSFHMMIVSVTKGNVQIIGKIKQKVRLAAGLNEDFSLDSASMERGWNCLRTFAERLQDIPRSHIRIVATATLRLATNADVFIQKAEQILGYELNVISGEEEARQIYLGAAYTSATQDNLLVIDIGGASTEVIVGNDLEPLDLVSLEMGCVTFMQRYFIDGDIKPEYFQHAIAAAKERITPVIEQFKHFTWQQCLGASGTPQAITEIMVSRGINDSITLSTLQELMAECCQFQHIDAMVLPGLQETRRAIFPSGLAILIALFECLDIAEVQLSGGALREGLIYGMLENMHASDIRQQNLAQHLEHYHIDQEQARRVSDCAMLFLDQTQLGRSDQFDIRGVLQAAAMLHEIGLHIDYKKHHQHGAYILSYISLLGYSKIQQECVRLLVLAHRQEIRLSVVSGLAKRLQPMVLQLVRILRLATLLSIRRRDNTLPAISLTCEGEIWTLRFPPGWLKQHPLIDAELANERWQQHKVGWELHFS